MSDLVAFLRARYAEARAAEMRKRVTVTCVYGDFCLELRSLRRESIFVNGQPMSDATYQGITGEPDPNPEVLADLASKLAIVEEFAPEPREPETDAELHARRAHPAWEYETTTGPRKQWDYSDEPPSDEHGHPDPTWKRNVDAGDEGWERFDYSEESYWRRKLAVPRNDQTEEPFVLCLLSTPFAGHPDYQPQWSPGS